MQIVCEQKLNNFEFFMNRGYALNRDKVKCRVCGGWLIGCTPYTHRINPNLPLNKVNKVNNLGIPTIRDRIVQECMRIVLEPILEAQFFAHSYGFRPMRDTAMAMERIKRMVHTTGQYWIVEGDISKCFDCIDHSVLIKRLYHVGIRDRRVLQIVKAMLKGAVYW